VRELKAFKRISLNAGEQTTVTLTININDLAFTNINMERVVEKGEFQLWVGGDSNAKLQKSFSVN